ncbi:MAG: SGNH/GDSL hydrolase family protein [Clostridia bacterium]|nr:SGNH/GDSL hydrolase family protein [Clostridia bacterium]
MLKASKMARLLRQVAVGAIVTPCLLLGVGCNRETVGSDASNNTVSPYNQVSQSVYTMGADKGGLRVLFVGNSMALHGPCEPIGWNNNWGMAASALEKDYIHVCMDRIRQTHPDAAFALCSASTWEANYRTVDEAMLEEYAAAREFDADIIVVRIVENCDNSQFTEEDKEIFVSQLEKLVNYLNADGEAEVMLTTGFWDHLADTGLIAYALKHGCPWVDLNDLGYQDQYKALGEYEHTGVCLHPNDAGMEAIATRICVTMEQMPAFQVKEEE